MNDIYLSLVIPAFNEEKRLSLTLNSIYKYFMNEDFHWEVIVVDDGSSDQTYSVAESYRKTFPSLNLIRNENNYGKGYSVRRGILQCRGQYVGFTDADYKTPMEEIEKIIPWLEKGFDVVIGSRGLDRSQIEICQPKYRQIGAKIFSNVMHKIIGLHEIKDTQCGFKFFQRSIAHDLFSRQRVNGYMFDVEILYLAKCIGYRIKEIPIRWRNDPDSRLQLVRGNLRNMKDLIFIWLNAGNRKRFSDSLNHVNSSHKDKKNQNGKFYL